MPFARTPARSPDDLVITARPLSSPEPARVERWWLGGDPVGTAVYNALSLTFPEGERFFIQSVRRFARDVSPKLAADIRAFTAQEGAHTREHLAFNRITADGGYAVEKIEARVRRVLNIVRWLPATSQLAVTVALEHFTAIFAHALLADPRHLRGAPADIARLWRWHAVEEVEHKGVAFDVFLAATARKWPLRRWQIRALAMALTTPIFLGLVAGAAVDLLKQDGRSGWRAWRDVTRWLWREPGLLRAVRGDYAAFYRRGFHPWSIDDRHLIAAEAYAAA